MPKRIYLYGLAGAENMYRVVDHMYIDGDKYSTKEAKLQAAWMKSCKPSIEQVYVIDQRPGLATDYKHAWRHNSIESHAIFKDILEREGIRVI